MPQMNERQSSSVGPIGREHECRILNSLFEQVCSGRPRTVLIGGEAGIGKTTLVEHFVADLQGHDVVVLTGSCFDVTSSLPYGPWREAMSRAMEMRGPPGESNWFRDEKLTESADQPEVFSGLLNHLQQLSSVSPVVLVLEDLHWSDQESVELLRYVARSLRDQPVCLIVTYRDDEISSRHPLYHALPHLVREARAERIDLRRLSSPVIQELVEQRYELAENDRDRLAGELEQKTQGNPFFIVELLRSMEMSGLLTQERDRWHLASLGEFEIPILIRQVIEQRVQQLDDAAQQALQTAAILGYEVQPGLWMSVSGFDETQLGSSIRQAIDAGLMEQAPHRTHLRFRHALVQDALYDAVPAPLRQLEHRRAGEVLAGRADADPNVVAEHFRQGQDIRGNYWSLEAARQARKLFAPYSIIQNLDSDSTSLESLAPAEHIEALQLRGWANEVAGDFEAAHRDYLAGYQQATESEDQRAEWDALIRLSELWAGRDYERSGGYAEQALQAAEEVGDQSLIAYSLNRLGNWYMNQEDPDRAREHHDQALEVYRSLDDLRGIAATEDLLGMTCTLGGDLVESMQHYQRAIELFELLDDQQALFSSLTNITHRVADFQSDMMVSAPGTVDECIEEVERSFQIARDIDYRSGQIYARMRLGACLGSKGEFQRALDELEEGIAGAESIGHRQWFCGGSVTISQLYLELFDYVQARHHATCAVRAARETGSRHWIRYNRSILAIAHLGLGDIDAAISELELEHRQHVPARTMAERQFWRAQIELELGRDDPNTALQFIDHILASTPHVSLMTPALRLSLLRGRALQRLGRFNEAVIWLRPALNIAREQGVRAMLWPLQLELGLAYEALGDRTNAWSSYAAARSLVDELGKKLHDSDIQERFLSEAYARIPEITMPTSLQKEKSRFGGLTRRQREVASLIALGNSNREIAESLSISERTVETHVTAILSTLDLTSRAQIAAWSVANGLVEPTTS